MCVCAILVTSAYVVLLHNSFPFNKVGAAIVIHVCK